MVDFDNLKERCKAMLITTKSVKALNFDIFGERANFILADFAETKEDLKNIELTLRNVEAFLLWLKNKGYTETLTQKIFNEYISFVFDKHKYSYANLIFSITKSFIKYLIRNEYCGFITFSMKPKRENQQETSEQHKAEEDNKPQKTYDYYKLLGIAHNATTDEIKRAYRVLALKTHPDVNRDDKYANERFSALNKVYHILSNNWERLSYDITMGYIKGKKENIKSFYTVYF